MKRSRLLLLVLLVPSLVLWGKPVSANGSPGINLFVAPGYPAHYMFGHHWPLGTVSIVVDDPSTGVNPDYSTDVESVVGGGVFADGFEVDFAKVDPAFGVWPGDVITATGGGYEKTLIVPNIRVTDVDVAADTVSGIAPPLASLWTTAGPLGARTVLADESGLWTVDWSVPGQYPDEVIVDIAPGMEGVAGIGDDDHDWLFWVWRLPLPAYGWEGFFWPVDNPDVVNRGKAGQTYPIRFRLLDVDGAAVSTTSSVTEIRYTAVEGFTSVDRTDTLETTASGAAGLRYDPETQQFIYNWRTPSQTGNYVLTVQLEDGTEHEAFFTLR